MRVISRLAQQRHNQIVDPVRPLLDEGEEVVHWVRARHPESNATGFLYVTRRRCIVRWPQEASPARVFLWEDVECWGVDAGAAGGPVIGIEAKNADALVQIVVETNGMVGSAREAIRIFAKQAPQPRSRLVKASNPERFESHGEVDITKQRKTLFGHTKRIVVTTVGIALVVLGIVLSLPLVPGPGFLLMLAGLGVLATDYDWAKDALAWAKDKYKKTASKLRSRSTTTD